MGAIGGVKGEVTGVKSQLSGMAGQLNTLQGELGAFKSETNEKFENLIEEQGVEQVAQGQLIKEMQEKQREFEEKLANPVAVGSASGSGGTQSNPYSGGGGFVPRNKRKIVVVGGFQNMTGEQVVKQLKELTKDFSGIKDIQQGGQLTTIGKLHFEDSSKMWTFLTSLKCKKLGEGLWHNIDQSAEERLLSKKVSFGVNKVTEIATSRGLIPLAPVGKDKEKAVHGDWQKGVVFVNLDRVTRIFEKERSSQNFVVCDGAADFLGTSLDYLEELLGKINELQL